MILPGKIYFVGAGPGDPDLLTVKALRLLTHADVVLHDALVPPAILSLAGPQASVVNVGKRCGAKTVTQGEINARIIAAARRGLSVVRLKSGDPGIFGRLAEEMDAIESAGLDCEVVPGVTAGVAAAASLGISLTDRRRSARVVIVTGHKAYGHHSSDKIEWKNLAREDAMLVIYMPGYEFGNLRAELLKAGLPSEIPAVIVSRASTPDHRHQFTTLADLAALPHFDSPSILLIGRSIEGASRKLAIERISHAIGTAELIHSSD